MYTIAITACKALERMAGRRACVGRIELVAPKRVRSNYAASAAASSRAAVSRRCSMSSV
jgi:hypothetical protein